MAKPRTKKPTGGSRVSTTSNVTTLTTGPITIDDVVAVARHGQTVELSPKAIAAMKRSRRVVEDCLTDGEAHYGINTGFGSLAKKRIGQEDLATLQRNLIRSHSAGVGEPLRGELVRAMMLVLAASLSRGLSGVRPVVVETLIQMLNKGVTPVVPSIGSVGASGDLAPLAHIALCLIGEGHATTQKGALSASSGSSASRALPGAKALAKAGIKPLELQAKEGLALINGTHLMCAEAALLDADLDYLLAAAHVALAMSIDGCRASHSFLDARLYEARPHVELAWTTDELRALLDGSEIVGSHAENDSRVQDPYSLRAGPTILGAAMIPTMALSHAVGVELCAVTDNPLVFPGESETEASIVSGANFHGMPMAITLDCLAISLCQIAGPSERRVYLMTGAFEPESNLKPFLTPKPGLQSGLMIAQYTAAACVNELIGLAAPASVSNISTCAGMEDYNSWGPRSAAKARRSLELATNVVAIELLCAAQALESHRPLKSGKGVEAAHRLIRKHVKPLTVDRPLTADIEAIAALISSGQFDGLIGEG